MSIYIPVIRLLALYFCKNITLRDESVGYREFFVRQILATVLSFAHGWELLLELDKDLRIAERQILKWMGN